MKKKLLFMLIALGISSYFYGQTYLTEGFEGGALPTGWSNVYESGTHDWAYQNGGHSSNPASAHTGSYNAIFYEGAYNNDATKLVTPEIDLSSATAPQLEFWHAQTKWASDQDTLAVYYRTSSSDSWHYLKSWNNNISAWTKETIDLPNKSATYQIAFHGYQHWGYGVVIDDIVVQEPPACPDPTAQTESNITSSSVDLGWTENGSATTWDIEYGPTGFTQGTGTTVTGVTTNPYHLTGLTSGTTYDWYVRADCGGGSTSSWAGPHTFTTLPPLHSFPLTEDFENGFTYFDNANGNTVNFADETTLYHGGSHSVHNAYSANNTNILHETGILDLSSTTNALLEFWHIAKTETTWDKCYVEISTDGGATYTALPATAYQGASSNYNTKGYFDESSYSIWGGTPDNNSWRKETFNLSTYNTTNVRFRFRLTSDGSNQSDGWYIDDIHIYEPSCLAPSAQTESNITTTSVDLGWTENGSANTWNIEYGPTGFTQGSGTTLTGVTSNPYHLTGLTSGTTYDWYVQTDCGGGSTSSWTGPHTFNTKCDATSIPYFENFDNVTAPAFPVCMTVENTNGDSKKWETYAIIHLSAPNAAKIGYNFSAAMDDWFFTRGLSLTGGVTYEVSFAYKVGSSSYAEKLAVDWGNDAVSTAMSGTPIFDVTTTDANWHIGHATFKPTTTGTYYVGFHGHSDADKYYLYVDDIKVLEQVTTATWTGGTDSDWDNPANWEDNKLPTSSTNVTIPTGLTNYPTLNSATTIAHITIASDASGDASILNDGLLVTSSATVQRFITKGKWHDFSASTQGQTLQSVYFNGNPDVWLTHYNENDNTRTYLTNLTDPMNLGEGFEIWVDANANNNVTINFNGELQSNDVIPALSYTGADPLGYNLIGNPFASPIALDSGTWGMANVDSTFWVWDPATTSYKDYNTKTKTGSLNGGIVPMGQGFFIHAKAASPTIIIPMAARVHSSQAYYKNTRSNDLSKLSLRAMFENDKYDELNVVFINGASAGFEAYDTRKMFAFSGNAPQVYSIITGEELSLNSLPVLNPGDERVVKVGYKAGVDGTQTLVADISNIEDTEVILEDLKLNTIQSLTDNPVYTFEAATGDNPDRFRIHFRSITGVDDITAAHIRAYAFDKNLYIVSKKELSKEKKELTVYDIMGRTLLKKTLPPGELIRVPVNASNAYVVVRVVSNGEVYTTKVFIQ